MSDKFLIFDVDNSLSAMGNESQIKEYTGGIQPVRINGGINQVKERLRALLDAKEVVETHPLFSESIKTTQYVPNAKATEIGLSGLVFDTLSHLFRQDMRILEAANKSGALEMTDWGKLERMYNSFISIVSSLPMWVIVNCHISYDKDQASGTFYYTPNVKGATKDSLQEYFDLVLYTKTSKDGKKVYSWQTVADSSKFAKDRLGILPSIVAQDFSLILAAYRAAGRPHPKILVIGESGTGKSKSLQTINKQERKTPLVTTTE